MRRHPTVASVPQAACTLWSHLLRKRQQSPTTAAPALPRRGSARKLALTMADLEELGIQYPSSALLKAFLVNSATYRAEKKQHKEFVESMDGFKKGHWFNVLGYGQPDASRATDCDDFSCLFYFDGHIERNKVAFFSVPVPLELMEAGRKRLTVTVCSTPEVQKNGLLTYLGTTTMWRMFRGDASHEEVVSSMGEQDDEEDDDEPGDEEENGPTN